MVRRGRPSLLGSMARTAAIAGTATAVSGKVAQKQARGAAQAAPPAAPPEPAVAAQSTGLSTEAMDQLKKLADLHEAGVLTDEEFAAQKARILH